MIIDYFIFYILGIIPIAECVLGSMRQFEDRFNTHVFHEILGVSLVALTVSWSTVGIFIGDYVGQFIAILLLEIAFPLYKIISGYDENIPIYLMRKILTFIIVLWVMVDAYFTYHYC